MECIYEDYVNTFQSIEKGGEKRQRVIDFSKHTAVFPEIRKAILDSKLDSLTFFRSENIQPTIANPLSSWAVPESHLSFECLFYHVRRVSIASGWALG